MVSAFNTQRFCFFLGYSTGRPSILGDVKVEDFSPEAPGSFVPTIEGAEAFVPAPLPSSVQLPPPTVRLLAQAENALGRLSGIAAREFNPYLVASPLLHREAILSSRMEGTVTTPEQLVLFEAGTRPEGAAPEAVEDAQEVLNYIHAMRRGLELLEELPVCLRLIKAVHGVLLDGVRGDRERPGEFRTSQNHIRGRLSEDIADARFVPPPPREMEACLHDLEAYLNRDLAPDHDPLLVQLALTHYQFETIHPFRDGNGRVGRLLLPLLLCAHERLERPVLYLSAYFERHRDLYVDLLLAVSQAGEWIPWIDFFLRGVRESAAEAAEHATALLELRKRYSRRFQKGRSSALLIRLIDRLFQTPFITIREAATLLDVTNQAAANNIHKLEEAGILEKVSGRRRKQVFIAREIMSFMRDSPPTSRGDQASP